MLLLRIYTLCPIRIATYGRLQVQDFSAMIETPNVYKDVFFMKCFEHKTATEDEAWSFFFCDDMDIVLDVSITSSFVLRFWYTSTYH